MNLSITEKRQHKKNKKQQQQQLRDAENLKQASSFLVDTPTFERQGSGNGSSSSSMIDKTLNSAQRLRRHLSFLGRSGATPLKETPFQPMVSLSLDPTADLPASSSSVKSNKITSPSSPRGRENNELEVILMATPITPAPAASAAGTSAVEATSPREVSGTPSRRRAITASVILDRFRSGKKDSKPKRFVEY